MLTLISQAALFTMLYSDSLARFVFDGEENFSNSHLPALGESSWKIVSSLCVLAIPSIFSGFLFKDLFVGFGALTFSDSIFLLPESSHFFESDFLPASWRILPVLTSFFACFLAIFGFDFLHVSLLPLMSYFISIYNSSRTLVVLFTDFFALNWFYDASLNYLTTNVFLNFCREATFKLLDKGLLEALGPYALASSLSTYSKRLAAITSGNIFHYAFLLIMGLAILLLVPTLSVESPPFELLFFLFFTFSVFCLNFDPTSRS